MVVQDAPAQAGAGQGEHGDAAAEDEQLEQVVIGRRVVPVGPGKAAKQDERQGGREGQQPAGGHGVILR